MPVLHAYMLQDLTFKPSPLTLNHPEHTLCSGSLGLRSGEADSGCSSVQQHYAPKTKRCRGLKSYWPLAFKEPVVHVKQDPKASASPHRSITTCEIKTNQGPEIPLRESTSDL